MSNSDDDSSASSVSHGSYDYESDLEDIFDDLCRRDDAEAAAAYAAGPDEQWSHITHSNRSAKMFEGLNKRVMPSNNFRLEYNYADSILLPKTKAEVKNSLKQLRNKLKVQPCDSGTQEFRNAIPDNAYRSQVCQHAAALGLEYILMVYCLPGSHPKEWS